jgi:hypothetical protein
MVEENTILNKMESEKKPSKTNFTDSELEDDYEEEEKVNKSRKN